MDDVLDGHTPELIELLELRARYVEQEISDRYRPSVARKYLPLFFDLHRSFVGALRRGALFEASALEERIFALSAEAAAADRPWLADKLFGALWSLNMRTGLFGGLVGMIWRHRAHAPHYDIAGGLIGWDYLQPERIGVFDKEYPDFYVPPTEASLKRRYLDILFEGRRAGYKSAQALLRPENRPGDPAG